MLGLPPYLRLCQEEIIDYVQMVRNVTNNIPILLYNNIMRNGYGATPETLIYLHQQGYIWGVKQASRTQGEFFSDCNQMFSLDSTIKLYTGSDVLFKELVLGNTLTHKFYGLTSILGNISPSSIGLMVMDFFIQSNDENSKSIGSVSKQLLDKRQEILSEFGEEVLIGCTLPTGLKYALKLKGNEGGDSRKPVGYLSNAKKEEIQRKLQHFLEYFEK